MAWAWRVSGWALIAAGATVGVYLAWTLLGTGAETRAAQEEMLEEWSVGTEARGLAGAEDFDAVDAPMEAPPPGSAVALLEFSRPGDDSVLLEGPLAVVAGVTPADLRKGPGHYPGTAEPGKPGNFAVAGHRTTYGSPFGDLDRLEPGDEIRVTDRTGRVHRYTVVEHQIVAPRDVWVLGPDPLGTGRATLTLTTCNPRFSNRERLVLFAELADA